MTPIYINTPIYIKGEVFFFLTIPLMGDPTSLWLINKIWTRPPNFYKLKSRGYDFEKVVERVSSLFQVEKDYITCRGRQKDRVRARDLLCYWAAIELGLPMVDLGRKFDMTPSAVSYAVHRGEKIAREGGYQLETWIILIFKVVPLFFIFKVVPLFFISLLY